MIGDLILYVKRILKQHIFCIHDYEYHNISTIDRCFTYYKCTKCGRIRDEKP